jgi:polysaccharide export outer membrane protein
MHSHTIEPMKTITPLDSANLATVPRGDMSPLVVPRHGQSQPPSATSNVCQNLAPGCWSCCLALLAGALLFTVGCQSTNPVASGGTETERAASPLHEGDVLRITFGGDTNLNTTVKVQLDGTINLQLVGDVAAAGKTLRDLQTDLMQRYQPLLRVNELTVTLVTTSASVYVSGAVLRPGRIPMDRPLTVLEAVMEAGGLTPNRAKPTAVSVLRTEDGKQTHYRVNLQKMLRGEDSTPFLLKPFDIIYVPEKTFNF